MHYDGIAGLAQDGLTILLEDQLSCCSVYIGHVRLTDEHFDARGALKRLRVHREGERLIPLVDKIAIEAEILERCHSLTIAILYHL